MPLTANTPQLAPAPPALRGGALRPRARCRATLRRRVRVTAHAQSPARSADASRSHFHAPRCALQPQMRRQRSGRPRAGTSTREQPCTESASLSASRLAHACNAARCPRCTTRWRGAPTTLPLRFRPAAGAHPATQHFSRRALTTPPADHRHLVGLAGSPGSGKTTTASAVVARVNALASAAGATHPFAALLPMDGFHLYRRQLDALPDPAEAHRRRGARDTPLAAL